MEKSKIFLVLLLIFYPIINFILINLDQQKFISVIFLYTISIISIIFLLSFYYCKKNLLIFKYFILFLFFWNLQFFFLDIKIFCESFVADKFDGYVTLLIIFSLSFLLYKLTISKFFFARFVLFFLLINISINFFNNYSFNFLKKDIKNINKIEFQQNKNSGDLVLNDRPNVFYIITDAMGSFNNLNKYGIDTTSIDNYLIDNNYQIAYDAKTSYTETSFAVTSIFYLDYFVNGIDKFYSIDSSIYPFFEKEQKLPLVNRLNEIGYSIYRVENNFARCTDHIKIRCLKTMDKNLINKLLNDYSLEVFFSSSLILSIIEKYIYLLKEEPFFVDGYDSIHQYKDIFKKNTDILDQGGNFTFIHHMSPHRPMRNANCEILNSDEKLIFSYKNYKTSVNCVFKRIEEISEIILKKYPNSIIVIQGDHGPTFEDNKDMGSSKIPNMRHIEDRIHIFNAMHLPNKCKNKFIKSLGTVETIRLILNCLGNTNIDVNQKSKTFMFFPEEKPNFINTKSFGF